MDSRANHRRHPRPRPVRRGRRCEKRFWGAVLERHRGGLAWDVLNGTAPMIGLGCDVAERGLIGR